MRSQITIAVFPFRGWFGAGTAVPTGFNLCGSVASFACFYDFVAEATIVAAPLCGHKTTFITFANSLTNHGNHPLLNKNIWAIKNGQQNGPYLAIITQQTMCRHGI
jgi:hypothetical protein